MRKIHVFVFKTQKEEIIFTISNADNGSLGFGVIVLSGLFHAVNSLLLFSNIYFVFKNSCCAFSTVQLFRYWTQKLERHNMNSA